MSPSEFDLRHALHQGEGQPLDPERIVAAGQARRAQRRTRLAGVAAAVILVGGIGGVTGALLAGDDGGGRSDAGPAGNAAPSVAESSNNDAVSEAPTYGATSSSSAPAPGGGVAPPRADEIACPTSFPQRLLPGGSGTDGSRLFPTTPVAVVVCSYGASDLAPGRTVLSEADAARLVGSLEAAADEPRGRSCANVLTRTEQHFAFVGVSVDGDELRTVFSAVNYTGCDTITTNGVAVRYGWSPDATLRALLARAAPSGPGPGSASSPASRPSIPPGRNRGSPPR